MLESRPTADGRYTLYAKYDSTNSKRTFAVVLESDTPGTQSFLGLILGYNAGAFSEVTYHTYNLSLATWYHVTATYENAGKTYSIRLKDTNGALGTDLTGTATLDANKLNVEHALLQ